MAMMVKQDDKDERVSLTKTIYASLLIRSYQEQRQTSVVPHPSYSPDLASADFPASQT